MIFPSVMIFARAQGNSLPECCRQTATNRFFRIPLFFICILFSGCAATWQSNDTAHMPAHQWPDYTHEEASSYLNNCRQVYERATTALHTVESNDRAMVGDLLDQLNHLEMMVNEPIGSASLFANVHPNDQVRAAAEYCEQKFMALSSDIYLSRPIYDRLLATDQKALDKGAKYYLEQTLQLFELAGVGLDESGRQRVRQLNAEIVETGQEFLANIRSDKRQIELRQEQLRGLPADFIASHPANPDGRVYLTTDYPDYFPLMQYAEDDDARRMMYVAFRQRGYPANKSVLERLLNARHELARLMGYRSFADYITADKMMGSAANAEQFINQITALARPRAAQDYALLLQRQRQIDPAATVVDDWQKTYLESLVQREVFAVDPQDVRQYFSYANVKSGIFALVEQLFGVQIEVWQTEVWHPTVEAYEIREAGEVLGRFYLDMHPRPGKYKHAAHFGIRDGVKNVQIPIAALVCNFPGGDGGTDLLEHEQVETFLHEFGHLLHTVFGGQVPWVRLSGTNTQRDFVEAPSQMLEEWVWDIATLQTFARNTRGDVIPEDLVRKMNRARDFGKGTWVLHQMYYAALSLNVYNQEPEKVDLDQLTAKLQNQYSPFRYVADTYMYAGFGHLDGYSAMYYTYMWSKVIATDLFNEFRREGLRDPQVAMRYRNTILAPGGSRPAAESIEEFLGRPFQIHAFTESLEGGFHP